MRLRIRKEEGEHMAHCTNCNHKWKKRRVWQLGFSKKGRECPVCRTKQFISFENTSPLIGLGYISATVAILFILFFPFLVELTEKEEKPF
jgi:hypothetical protein